MADFTLPSRLTLEIVTPDRSLVQETVDEVQVPAAEGYMGILPGHTSYRSEEHTSELQSH